VRGDCLRAAVRCTFPGSWHHRAVTTVLQYLVIAGVIGLVVFGIAVLVFGRGEQLAPLSPRISPTELPDLDITGGDVEKVRFAMAVRGYRMSDVDWAMRRLGAEIDRLRAELDRTVGDDRPSPPAADEPTDQRVFAVVTPAEVAPGSAARTEDTDPGADR
jgi:DivIVA domain-containing protein